MSEKEKDSFIRKIPGFRSGTTWKMVLAMLGYGFLFLILLATVSSIFDSPSSSSTISYSQPTAIPTAASTNQNEQFIAALIKSNDRILPLINQITNAANNYDISSLKSLGLQLKSESEQQYAILGTYQVTGNLIDVKNNYLLALENFRLSGDNTYKGAVSFENGNTNAATDYITQASSYMEMASKYVDMATDALPN